MQGESMPAQDKLTEGMQVQDRPVLDLLVIDMPAQSVLVVDKLSLDKLAEGMPAQYRLDLLQEEQPENGKGKGCGKKKENHKGKGEWVTPMYRGYTKRQKLEKSCGSEWTRLGGV